MVTSTGWNPELGPARAIVPGPIRRAYTAWRDRQALRAAVRALLRLEPGEVPSLGLLAALRRAWGNDGYAADVEFLSVVATWAARTSGPILEAGSGVTTLVLAAVAGRRGIPIWVLEHEATWLAAVDQVLAAHALPATTRHAPLVPYDGYQWYARPPGLPRGFVLVVCDGPPGDVRGGRYGLLPVLRGHLASDAYVLVDDADRQGEAAILERWRTTWSCVPGYMVTPTGTLAVVRVP